MRNGQTRSFRTVFLAGFLLVSVLIYFRPSILGALGYADVGMPRTIFILASIIAMRRRASRTHSESESTQRNTAVLAPQCPLLGRKRTFRQIETCTSFVG